MKGNNTFDTTSLCDLGVGIGYGASKDAVDAMIHASYMATEYRCSYCGAGAMYKVVHKKHKNEVGYVCKSCLDRGRMDKHEYALRNL